MSKKAFQKPPPEEKYTRATINAILFIIIFTGFMMIGAYFWEGMALP